MGKSESVPRLDGRNMVMVLAPEKRAKPAGSSTVGWSEGWGAGRGGGQRPEQRQHRRTAQRRHRSGWRRWPPWPPTASRRRRTAPAGEQSPAAESSEGEG